MEAYLRNWFQSALSKQAYDSAIFVGDKLLALTNSDDDAFSLAQAHFSAGNYLRALAFVTRSDLIQRSTASKYLAAHCYIKLNKHEDALGILGEKNPVHLLTSSDSARRKLQHLGDGLTGLHHGKTRIPARIERADRSEERDQEDASNIKYEAGMCYLRGLCYVKQNALDRAKECYKDAVRIDVQCFEAFDQLMKNSLMGPKEEWDFLNSLNFDSIPSSNTGVPHGEQSEAADFTRNLYITRLSKYVDSDQTKRAVETLSTHYRLSQNPDVLLCVAEQEYTCSRLQAALAITTQILDLDPYNFACIPLHLAILHQLNQSRPLFALSHDLADTHPAEPCTWLAVGTYYLAINRVPEARSYFSKASLMDPQFGPAWIGFAHTFAAEGENDQAIAAYSTAARLFQGTHLPQLFLGMQENALGNLGLAREYLTASYNLCDCDPLLINELGVVSYMEEDYGNAAEHFEFAIRIAEKNRTPDLQVASTRLNLAHALRRAGRFDAALDQYDAVIRVGMREADVFTSKGLIHLELEQPFDALVVLHAALALSPHDPIADDLMKRALTQTENTEVLGGQQEEDFDRGVYQKVAAVRAKQKAGRGGRRRQALTTLAQPGRAI